MANELAVLLADIRNGSGRGGGICAHAQLHGLKPQPQQLRAAHVGPPSGQPSPPLPCTPTSPYAFPCIDLPNASSLPHIQHSVKRTCDGPLQAASLHILHQLEALDKQ